MAKRSSGARRKDDSFELLKKAVIILAFLIGFAAMTYFILNGA